MGSDPAASEPAIASAWMGGRARLIQAERGYRAGMDAALLAAACDAEPGERVLDAGCGVGAVLVGAAALRPGAQFVGVERDPAALALARENLTLNALDGRAEVREGDVTAGAAGAAGFDLALANPPYFDDPGALRGPAPEKAGAWLAQEGLSAWLSALVRAVRDGGRIIVIHRSDRLADILGSLARRAGSFQIRPVHPFADAPARRVLVRAVRAGRAPLVLLPALVLHPRDGSTRHTAEAEAVLRGDLPLAWR